MKDRLAAFQKQMPEGVDAVLITSPINRRYYLGFPSSAGTVVVTKKKSYLIIDSRYFEAAQEKVQAKNCTVVLQDKLLPQIQKILKQHRVKALGIESQSVTVSALRKYQEAFVGIELVTDDQVSDAMAKQRAVKSQEEIDCIREAQRIADKGFTHILNFIESGKTEIQVAVELDEFCRRNGSQGPSFATIIASGRNSSMPHAVPSEKLIQSGDFITMDYGATIDGYGSDMTRTVAVGSVNSKQREVYETVLAAQLNALEAVKAGAACKAVDKIARDIIDVSEFKGTFGHGLGHCIGLEIHEEPRLSQLSADTLLEGMITSVEPGIYLPGEFGVRIEDIAVVTKDGCDNLCDSPKELIIL